MRGDGLLGIVGRGRIDGQTDLDAREMTDATAADKLARFAKLFVRAPRALLTADLKNAAGLRDLGREHHALGVRHRERLLEINIVVRAQRRDRDLGVLVVGQADHDSVDVFSREQFVIISVNVDRRLGRFRGGEETLDVGLAARRAARVEVAHGDDIGEARVRDAGHVVPLTDAAAADVADANAIARRVGAEEPRRNNERRDDSGDGGGANEIATGD